MANTDFIMVALNLTEDQVQSINPVVIQGIMHIHITLNADNNVTCPFCGGPVHIHGYNTHTYNHLDIAGVPSKIEWKRRRYKCKDCNRTFMEDNPFGPEKFHQTYAVLSSIAVDLKNYHMSFHDIAEKHHVSSTLVELYADSFLQVPRVQLSENIGVDEIRSDMAKYGGTYLFTIVDNVHRSLTEVLPNRSKKTISDYFEKIPLKEREKVKYLTMDMWDTYKEVALKYLPNVRISVDPFHVVKNLSDGFNRIRIDIMNQCVKESPEYYLLKHWHKLLETDYHLDNEPKYNSFFKQKMNFRDYYELLLGLNPNLNLAYQLKEMYRDFNRSCTFEEAPARLNQLIEIFEEADLYCYREFVGMLNNWKPEIINSFERPYENRKQSNALTENTNERLRGLLTISNGFANFERFRARAIYCFNNHVFYSLTSHLSSQKREGKKRGHYKKRKPVLQDDPNNSVDTMVDGPDNDSE